MQDRDVDQPPGIPGWVKLLAIGAAVVVALLVLAMLIAGGEHGPGRHLG